MKTIVAIIASSITYATLRYSVFKGVAWSQWPAYVLNKAVALAALLILVAIVVAGRSRLEDRARWIAAASWLMLVHVGLSLALLGPDSYSALFVDGLPTTAASASLLLGVVAAAASPRVLRFANHETPAPSWPKWIGLLALAAGLHAGLLGFQGWATPEKWPGGMPPITLLSFGAGIAGIIAGGFRCRVTTSRNYSQKNQSQ